MTNTNCLENIKCPDCGNEDRLRIAAAAIFTVTDEGTDDYGDVEWHDDSYAECAACYRRGTLKDFMVLTRSTSTTENDAAMHRRIRVFTEIARTHLGIPTLETQRSDSLDFHDVAVWNVAAALKAAFDAGATSVDAINPPLLDALRLAQSALNTAPRFRVGDTDSYKIAAQVDRAIDAVSTRREP